MISEEELIALTDDELKNKTDELQKKEVELNKEENSWHQQFGMHDDVSYYRRYTKYETKTFYIVIAVAVISWLDPIVWFPVWWLLWTFERKVVISPTDDDGLMMKVRKKLWKSYRKQHNLSFWKQFSREKVAEKTVDEKSKKALEELKRVRKEKAEVRKELSMYQQEKAVRIDVAHQKEIAPVQRHVANGQALALGNNCYLDYVQQQIVIDYGSSCDTINFSDIIDFTPIKKEHSEYVSSGGYRGASVKIGKARVYTGSHSTGRRYYYVDRLSVQIVCSNGQTLDISFVDQSIDKNSNEATELYSLFNQLCSMLKKIIKDNNAAIRRQQTVRRNSSSKSVATELTKFKKLLDSGAITQEEFDEQKAKLLH